MSWFEKGKSELDASQKRTIGEGVFRRCDQCNETMPTEDFLRNLEVCPNCGFHYRLSGEQWLALLVDEESFVECDAGITAADPLGFVDAKPYGVRLEGAMKQTGLEDAMLEGEARIEGRPVQFGEFMFRFMGGSMGAVVGERITRMFERGAEKKQPVILLTSSGGARMQEGALSLMQMAKTVSALRKLREAGVPFLSILLNPTTGGVAASFAFLGDVNIAEPNALIGFAGPRVIETTIRQSLPPGFQKSEFLLEHGMIDLIVPRSEMRATIARVLSHLMD
ncbi:MAG: acetyl-CoA carboxylase, carboxyltransferase subunit beta [Polyangiales bacterium]